MEEKKRVDIEIHLNVNEDIMHFRELLGKIEELIELAADKELAREIEDEILDITKQLIHGSRKKNPPPDY